MFRDSLKANFAQIGLALREPENFTLRWHRDAIHQPVVCLALALTAVAGTLSYGITMGIGDGATAIVRKATLLTIAAGFAWGIPLPALYVLNSLTGSRLKASTTLLAVLVTTSWGGLALIASVPINWFFSVAIPAQVPELFTQTIADGLVLCVNLLVFAGVGVSMGDVFHRVMYALEPARQGPPTWVLVLVAVIGSDLFYLFGLFAG